LGPLSSEFMVESRTLAHRALEVVQGGWGHWGSIERLQKPGHMGQQRVSGRPLPFVTWTRRAVMDTWGLVTHLR
jgi:hypothetical protein